MRLDLVSLLSSYMTPVVYGIFFITIAAYIVLSFVLEHHWRKYGLGAERVRMMRLVYLFASGIVIAFMVLVLPGIFQSL